MNQIQKDWSRFVILCEVFDYQRPTFQYSMSQAYKMRFNNLNTHLQSFRNEFLRTANEEVKEYIEEMGALAWEMIDELDKAADKKMLLALIKAYNKGLVQIKDDREELQEAAA